MSQSSPRLALFFMEPWLPSFCPAALALGTQPWALQALHPQMAQGPLPKLWLLLEGWLERWLHGVRLQKARL